jgi:hypothetical protein
MRLAVGKGWCPARVGGDHAAGLAASVMGLTSQLIKVEFVGGAAHCREVAVVGSGPATSEGNWPELEFVEPGGMVAVPGLQLGVAEITYVSRPPNIRTGELQAWFLAEHLVDTPLVRTDVPGTVAADAQGSP